MRILISFLLIVVSAATASADVLLVKRGKKLQVLGLKGNINGVVIGPNNFLAFVDKSKGIVEREGYDGVWFVKSGKGKAVFYPASQVIDTIYSTQPAILLDGFDSMSVGAWRQALAAFRRCAGDQSVRPVFRAEARYRVGICAIRIGSPKAATEHFKKWDITNSRFTPMVYRLLGELLMGQKKYKSARSWYAKIAQLEDITPRWKHEASLGDVKVDIRERKFDMAEGKARALARTIGSDKEMSDPLALAYTLQAQAVIKSGKAERLPEAEKILRSAAELKGVSDRTMAQVFSALGDAVYAQRKPERARYEYMRVVTLYPNESSYVANALQNAGICFLDMSGGMKNDQAKADELLVTGMKLLGECAGRHRKTTAGRQARVMFRKRKADLEAAKKRLGS